YAVDNEEFIDGMVAVSVPIRGKNGRLGACLFIHAPIIRKSLDELLLFEPIMRNAADELSKLT
ncbi:MAG: IclR family transcriptional regulator, partial [Colwellia sp.]|nr:IclR family transcriptional regulator [Colwellia sp.]